jgi:hypothetical protein
MINTIWNKIIPIIKRDNNKENVYCDESGNIFNSLNTSLQDSLYLHVVWTWVTCLYSVTWFELICHICLCFCIIIQNGQKSHSTIIYTIATCTTFSCPVTGVWIYKMYVRACVWGGVGGLTPMRTSSPLFPVSMSGIFLSQPGCWPPQHWNLWSLDRPFLDAIFLLTQHYHFCTFGSPLRDTRLSTMTATETVNQAEIV